MAELFNNQPGKVIALTGPTIMADNPFRVLIGYFPEDATKSGILLTELAIQRHGNYQMLHTLKDLVYVYSFGERVGQIRASGLAFTQACDDFEGVLNLTDYYENNRLENRSEPLSIVFGNGSNSQFRSFLVEMNISIAQPELRIAQFGLQFITLPSAKETVQW
jgi:hypothetical protein